MQFVSQRLGLRKHGTMSSLRIGYCAARKTLARKSIARDSSVETIVFNVLEFHADISIVMSRLVGWNIVKFFDKSSWCPQCWGTGFRVYRTICKGHFQLNWRFHFPTLSYTQTIYWEKGMSGTISCATICLKCPGNWNYKIKREFPRAAGMRDKMGHRFFRRK